MQAARTKDDKPQANLTVTFVVRWWQKRHLLGRWRFCLSQKLNSNLLSWALASQDLEPWGDSNDRPSGSIEWLQSGNAHIGVLLTLEPSIVAELDWITATAHHWRLCNSNRVTNPWVDSFL
jgi:hypothetical protein